MNRPTRPLEELVQELPQNLYGEVRDFIEFLLTKHTHPGHRQLRQDWAEALKDGHPQDTSVDSQHRALVWRTE